MMGSRLLAFRGRDGRTRFATILAVWLMFIGWDILIREDGVLEELISILAGISLSVLLICSTVRRLHDLGRTGWYSLLSCIPILNAAFGLWLVAAPGEPMDNRFGPNLRDEARQRATPA